jgi:NADPH:quinone reductase-like Zn-dependent oxidoreductase
VKAFVVRKYGPDGVERADVPAPAPGRHEVLVDVRAASINPLDKMVRDGEFKQLLRYKRPFVLGHDLAGVITQVGSEVRDFKVGDEVYSRPRDLRIGAAFGVESQLRDGGDVDHVVDASVACSRDWTLARARNRRPLDTDTPL